MGLVWFGSVPLPAEYSSVSSSWLYCCIWSGLSVVWEFVEFSLLWSFLAVGGVVLVAYQGFLIREACVGVLVDGAGFFSLWNAMKCPVMSYEMSVDLE